MKNQAKKQFRENNENGNVLVIVLITIALLAALTFAFIDGDKGNNTNTLSKGEAKVAASNIMKYAKSIENAVKQVRLVNGCSEGEISFEDGSWGHTYYNYSTPDSCKIFHLEGGGVGFRSPDSNWLTGVTSGGNYGEWLFIGQTCLADDIGSSCQSDGIDNEDLVMFLNDIDENICIEINKSLGIGSPPFEDASGGMTGSAPLDGGCMYGYSNPVEYRGAFADAGNSWSIDIFRDRTFNGNKTMCVQQQGCGQRYVFYHALIER